MSDETDQSEVVAFLRSPAAWPPNAGSVDCIETHGALVFMAGADTLKLRRAVRLPYLDFSTLAARRNFADREVALNSQQAPGLYRGVVAITRESSGRLALGGDGAAVDWVVRMARFSQDALLSSVASTQGISEVLAQSLGDMVFAYHAAAPVPDRAPDRVSAIAGSVLRSLRASTDPRMTAAVDALASGMEAALARSADVRARRASAGFIRRCHGDLHLGNVVTWQGRPVAFDAIEFDEAIATIDTLYDLAFLLMDVDRQASRQSANFVLNRYLWRSGDPRDLEGLAALPVYLALRAAIRAMVGLDRAAMGVGDKAQQCDAAVALAEQAAAYLAPQRPTLVAIGGLSGTGKTTLARALAPSVGVAPGAVHLRSDLERKWLAGVDALQRLPPASYTRDASLAAYDRVVARARVALGAGHGVIVDAVFADPSERSAVKALAHAADADFCGIWLTGQVDTLKRRVAQRTGDASDATPEIVDRQSTYDTGEMTWNTLDASGEPEAVTARARAILHDRG